MLNIPEKSGQNIFAEENPLNKCEFSQEEISIMSNQNNQNKQNQQNNQNQQNQQNNQNQQNQNNNR